MSEPGVATGARQAAAVPLAALLAPRRYRAIEAADALATARAEGFAAGQAAAEAALRERIEALESEVAEARATCGAELAAAERRARAAADAIAGALAEGLAVLGLAVARAVLAAEPRATEAMIEANLARLLSALPPGAVGTLAHAPGAAVPAAALPPGWVLAADPALAHDALRAELGMQALESSMAQQLAAALARLEGAD